MTHTISETPGADFIEHVKFSAVFVECHGKFLYMRRTQPEHVAGQWGVVGGVVEEGETFEAALAVQLLKETGLTVNPQDFKFVRPLYITTPQTSFGFYVHVLSLDEIPQIVLTEDHDEFSFMTIDEVLELKHIYGGLKLFLYVAEYFEESKTL